MVRLDLGMSKSAQEIVRDGRFGRILKYVYLSGVFCIRQPTALTTVHLQFEMILRCLIDTSFGLSSFFCFLHNLNVEERARNVRGWQVWKHFEVYIHYGSVLHRAAYSTYNFNLKMILRCLIDSFELSSFFCFSRKKGEAGPLHTCNVKEHALRKHHSRVAGLEALGVLFDGRYNLKSNISDVHSKRVPKRFPVNK